MRSPRASASRSAASAASRLHFRPPRQGRNPKTGEAVALAGKYVPHFKPGKDLRERVNEPLDELRPSSRSRPTEAGAAGAAPSRRFLRRAAARRGAVLFTALNQQRFEVDVAVVRFGVSSGLALLIAFAAGLLAGALWRSAGSRACWPIAADCATRCASPRPVGPNRRLRPTPGNPILRGSPDRANLRELTSFASARAERLR